MMATRAPMMSAGAVIIPPGCMIPTIFGPIGAQHRPITAFITESTMALHAKSMGRPESANPESVDSKAKYLTGALEVQP